MKIRSALVVVFAPAILCFVLELGLSLIPYVGAFLGIGLAFGLGKFIAWGEFSRWEIVIISIFSMTGFFLGFSHQVRFIHEQKTIALIGTFICTAVFLWSFLKTRNYNKYHTPRVVRDDHGFHDSESL